MSEKTPIKTLNGHSFVDTVARELIADSVSIESVKQTSTSTSDGGTNTLTVTLTNGTKSTFNVKNGSKGSDGATGPKGDKGDKGDTGSQGPKGDKGDKGDTGPQGPKGDKGDTGPQGPNGNDGAAGPKGDKGDAGSSGAAGYTPVKGVDYWTEAEKTAIKNETYDALSVVIGKELANRKQLPVLFADSINECEDVNSLYVLPDNYIYANMFALDDTYRITYEGRDGGYYSSDQEWRIVDGAACVRTNIIPVMPGDKFSYIGNGATSAYSVVFLNDSQARIDRQQYSARTEPVTITVPSGAAYAWFQSFEYSTTHGNIVFKVEWLVCQGSEVAYNWVNTGHAFVATSYEDRIIALENDVERIKNDTTDAVGDILAGKYIVYDGDSIANPKEWNGYAYSGMIDAYTGRTSYNDATGGAHLTSTSDKHSIVNNIVNLPTNGDLYCFEGGINDYWGNVPIGTCSDTDYTGEVNTATICGALETIFRYSLNTFVGKPICFVITHKVQKTGHTKNNNGDTFKDYRDAMVKVCNKYSIPYYDAFTESGLNGWNDVHKNAFTGDSAGTPDGIHPNAAGYKRYYVPQLLALFRRIMPVD